MKKKSSDVLHHILDDHEVLRESIDVILSEEISLTEKKSELEKFLRNLQLHTRTEKVCFYDAVVSLKGVRPWILHATEEHNIADNLVRELEGMSFKRDWTDEVDAKAKVLAELVKRHAEEEEAELFPVVKANLTKTELDNLGVVYLQKRKEFKNDLQESYMLPTMDDMTNLVYQGWRGALHRVTSYVSKINPSR
jgi:hemerythrin-like domain-containing protein